MREEEEKDKETPEAGNIDEPGSAGNDPKVTPTKPDGRSVSDTLYAWEDKGGDVPANAAAGSDVEIFDEDDEDDDLYEVPAQAPKARAFRQEILHEAQVEAAELPGMPQKPLSADERRQKTWTHEKLKQQATPSEMREGTTTSEKPRPRRSGSVATRAANGVKWTRSNMDSFWEGISYVMMALMPQAISGGEWGSFVLYLAVFVLSIFGKEQDKPGPIKAAIRGSKQAIRHTLSQE